MQVTSKLGLPVTDNSYQLEKFNETRHHLRIRMLDVTCIKRILPVVDNVYQSEKSKRGHVSYVISYQSWRRVTTINNNNKVTAKPRDKRDNVNYNRFCMCIKIIVHTTNNTYCYKRSKHTQFLDDKTYPENSQMYPKCLSTCASVFLCFRLFIEQKLCH